jgi:hypothetical protein
MQNVASDDPRSIIRDESCRSVVANLAILIEHLSVSRKALEVAIIRETAQAGHDMDEDFIVLDDVTPCYLSASAALSACDAALAVTLHELLGTYPTKVEASVSQA